jgi:superfamily I DNA/RNA helicase
MIEQAVVAAAENPGIVNEKLLIIDEYQDFNASEDALIENVVRRAKGVMIAGDDEQVLYTSLRDGTPDLIRERYQSDAFAKAMLPLCSRCGFHICRASRHFADSVLKDESIHKVFEPLDTDDKGSPIKMVACPLPSSALDYIERFLKEHEHEITERQIAINDGSNTDHCVLILSQSATASFLKTKRSQKRYDALLKTIRDYECAPEQEQSRRDMDYIAVFEDSTDNYRLRRVLYHEGVEDPVVRQLIHEAIGRGVSLSELESPVIEAAIKTCADVIESSLRDAHETMDIVAEFQKLQEAALDDLTRVHGSPVELITIQKAKGLTADHVLLLGFDDTNMSYVSQSAFYVALTRAKVSLHIVTSLGAGGASRPHDYLDLLPDENLEFFTHTVRDATSEPLSSRQHYLKYLENCEERNRRFRK